MHTYTHTHPPGATEPGGRTRGWCEKQTVRRGDVEKAFAAKGPAVCYKARGLVVAHVMVGVRAALVAGWTGMGIGANTTVAVPV